MSERHIHVTFDEEHGGLPIEKWRLIKHRWGYPPGYAAVAYAKKYSWVNPKLWLRKRPVLLSTVSALAAVVAVGIILGILVDPAAFLISVFAAALVPLIALVGFDGELDGDYDGGPGGDFVGPDRSRPVMRVSGAAVPKILDAYENNPEATLASLRVLAKGTDVATDEALDLATEIIERLAKNQRELKKAEKENQRELEEAEKARKEAEAAALAEFTAAAEVAPIIDRSDEIALIQLSAELDLQGK